MSDRAVVINGNITSELMEKKRMGEATPEEEESLDIVLEEADDQSFSEEKLEEMTKVALKKAKREADQILERAENQSKAIIGEAVAEADKIKLKAQRELNDQIEKIKETERANAKEEARADILSELAKLTDQMNSLMDELRRNQKSYFLEAEEKLPQLALEIAGKILFKKVSCHPEEMDMLIKNALSGIKGATWIDLKLGQGLKNIADDITGIMGQSLKEKGTILDVQTDLENNWQIICESDKGIIDASINTQIKNFMNFIDANTNK